MDGNSDWTALLVSTDNKMGSYLQFAATQSDRASTLRSSTSTKQPEATTLSDSEQMISVGSKATRRSGEERPRDLDGYCHTQPSTRGASERSSGGLPRGEFRGLAITGVSEPRIPLTDPRAPLASSTLPVKFCRSRFPKSISLPALFSPSLSPSLLFL